MEVPITGSDCVKFVDVQVPRLSEQPDAAAPATLLRDAASCFTITTGDHPTYLIWIEFACIALISTNFNLVFRRIHKSVPNVLELLEICAYKEFPRIGLRITFPYALCPSAFICKGDEIRYTSGSVYALYVATVCGSAYLFKLRHLSTYASSSVFSTNEFIEFSDPIQLNAGAITAAAAIPGCLVVGKSDGSVGCIQLGRLDPSAPGFLHELRGDVGISRLWGFVSRGRPAGAVQDLIISEVQGRKFVFVLHLDGSFRVWDLLSHSRIFSHNMNIPDTAGKNTPRDDGTTFLRLWVGEANYNKSVIPLAILMGGSPAYSQSLCSFLAWTNPNQYFATNVKESSKDMVSIYCLQFSLGDRSILLLDESVQSISLEEGRLVDLKLTSTKMWLLKQDGLISKDLSCEDGTMEDTANYSLQESFVAEQLFQSMDHFSDDLLWIIHSAFVSVKDKMVPFISSIFLHRLLHPGVYNNSAVRATLQDYNKNWTDSEFQSLTADGLKKEILSLIEYEDVKGSPVSTFYFWKSFCNRYFHYWCTNGRPCGLIVDPSRGTVGLIRKNSMSLFRRLENIELLIYGCFDELGDTVSSQLGLNDSELENEILFEVLGCVSSISQHLGKSASAIFYESLVNAPVLSLEEIIPCLLKILEMGYSSSVSALHISELGVDAAWEKELTDHKNLRKFSVEMLLSLHALFNKASAWDRVLNVVESYLKFLVPRKIMQRLDADIIYNVNTSILVQAAAQVAKVMFESAFDMLLFLSYLVKISHQIHMGHDDISRIQLELIPMIQETFTEWLIIHYFCTTPSESPVAEDFSSQLSSLQIDSSFDKRLLNENLGKCGFSLAFILLLYSQCYSGNQSCCSLKCLPSPDNFMCSIQDFSSWLIWGRTGEESSAFFGHSTELAQMLLRHGQYEAVEYLLTVVDSHSRKEKISESIQSSDGKWCALQHLLGCCLLARSKCGLYGKLKDEKVCEAVRCFFRASSGQGASEALQSLSYEARLPHPEFTGYATPAVWKLQYYQWVMQIFEQYNLRDGACQFALAALEQVDEALNPKEDGNSKSNFDDSAIIIKGRLWANVFKFTLDLDQYYDAYCAIISNPDEESKYICLRRFIIVLYERGALKILCNGQLPFIGLAEKIEQELAWKAQRSNLSAKPNPYKLLYAYEMHRHNWRKAATCMYLYSARLRTEVAVKDHQTLSLALQERMNGLSVTINALRLVHPAYAWIDLDPEGNSLQYGNYPTSENGILSQRQECYIGVEKLEKEYVLATAEYLLSLEKVTLASFGNQKPSIDFIDLLVQRRLYDIAFTVVLKFWSGSELKRELERIIYTMSLQCCPSGVKSSSVGNDSSSHGLLLALPKDAIVLHGSMDRSPSEQCTGSNQWESLELYLDKYKSYNQRLPALVAESLLRANPQIELPLWLVRMFKVGQRDGNLGMSTGESDPATLFRLYVDYGRYAEATNLLIEYIRSYASVRPVDIIRRKRPSAVWFPYTTIERLWAQLEDLSNSGQMNIQCEKIKGLLRDALVDHLNQRWHHQHGAASKLPSRL
ncbi:Nuclear pore complex protein NUP160, partial [Dillenia turbinata]